MATVVFMRQTRQTGLTGYFNNDPIAMVEDGQEVGSKVDPDINPTSPFQIVDVPGILVADLDITLASARGPEQGTPGNERRPLVHKRRYTMEVNNLPLATRSAYNQGDRISLTEAEYNAAVNLKPGQP